MSHPQSGLGVPIRVDLDNACVWRGAQRIALRPKDCDVLRVLVERPGQLVSKGALLEAGWPQTFVDEAVLKNSIRRLRQALGDKARQPRFIETVHRHGYRLQQPLSVVDEPPSQSPAPASSAQGLRPIVGRETELARLHRWLRTAQGGIRQEVFVTGEAGAGKTTLVDQFVETVRHDPALWVGQGQCLDHYGAGEAYLPVFEALGRLGRGPNGPSLIACLSQYAPTWLAQMPSLLRPAEFETLQRRVIGATRERMLRELADALEVLTIERTLLLILEDLHWSDPSTLDVLALFARRREPARLLIVGTYRPEEITIQHHPLHAVIQDLRIHQQSAELPLSLLSQSAIEDYLVQRFPGASFPEATLQQLCQRTEGNPLFLVNVVDAWLAHGWLEEIEGQWIIQREAGLFREDVPDNLRQLVNYRLAQCTSDERRLLEVASVAGVEFASATVASGLGEPVEDVDRCCMDLAQRGLFLRSGSEHIWPDGTVAGGYEFIHALYQEVIYDLVPVARRVQAHQRLGQRLEIGYGEQVAEIAAALALHFEYGRDFNRTLNYLQQAALKALSMYANREAIGHLERALALVHHLPTQAERDANELAVLIALGPAVTATQGYGSEEVAGIYQRARALCQESGDTSQRFNVAHGMALLYRSRAEYNKALELGEELRTLAEQAPNPSYRFGAHLFLGSTRFFRGELRAAMTHFNTIITDDSDEVVTSIAYQHGLDLALQGLTTGAWALWILGYPDQAAQRIQRGLDIAYQFDDPFGLVRVFTFAGAIAHCQREAARAQEWAESLIAISSQQGFPFRLAQGQMLQGWALIAQGGSIDFINQMQHGLQIYFNTGSKLDVPYWLFQLADAYGIIGDIPQGLILIDEALSIVNEQQERYYEAELFRLKGDLLLKQADPNLQAAETCFQRALHSARQRVAKSWELRAAISLARLWQSQGKRQDAYDLLAPVYGWFTEGLNTADLIDAKALFDELA